MKRIALALFAFALPAYADFSYKVTTKTAGALAAMGGGGAQPSVSTYYYKGQKMKADNGTVATVIDFDARTITTINNSTKTVSVKSFDQTGAAAAKVNATIDVKETGQKKMVNGFNASELVMTMDVDAPPGRQMGNMKMKMTMNMWLSSEVPGLEEVYAFHQRNAGNFPWAAMQGNTNSAMTAQMAEVQRKIAGMHGVPVQQVIRMGMGGGGESGMPGMPQMPQMSPAQAAQMAQARQKLEAMAGQGGPAAAAAQQALARMGGMGASGGASAPGAMFEVTLDASDFSGASIPDSVFAIPADYKKVN